MEHTQCYASVVHNCKNIRLRIYSGVLEHTLRYDRVVHNCKNICLGECPYVAQFVKNYVGHI